MKKIINGKLYDTDKARYLGGDSAGDGFAYWCEELYVKRTGEYFLYGKGGAMTKYAETIGQNQWSGGEKIMPLSIETARKWAEEHLRAEDYESIFGLPDEDAEPVALSVMLPARLASKLRTAAAEEQISVTAYLEKLLTKEFE